MVLDESEPLGLRVDGELEAVAWNIPTGTTDVWRLGPAFVLLVREWVDPDADVAPMIDGLLAQSQLLGTFSVTSGWVVVLWSPEPGRAILAVEPEDGLTLSLSVGDAALLIQIPPGEYECRADSIVLGDRSARRCLISPV